MHGSDSSGLLKIAKRHAKSAWVGDTPSFSSRAAPSTSSSSSSSSFSSSCAPSASSIQILTIAAWLTSVKHVLLVFSAAARYFRLERVALIAWFPSIIYSSLEPARGRLYSACVIANPCESEILRPSVESLPNSLPRSQDCEERCTEKNRCSYRNYTL